MASTSSTDKRMIVDVHYQGVFTKDPIVYNNPLKASVRDVDFNSMGFTQFVGFIESLLKFKCNDLYYCPTKEPLSEGIKRMDNDDDYKKFLEVALENDNRISMYVDHYKEPILDWLKDSGTESEEEEDDEEVDSRLSDPFSCDHEVDEEVASLNKTKGDAFLDKLCVDYGADSEQDAGAEKDLPVYPVHDCNKDWRKMVPIVGMKFANPDDLKELLSNYAVANGYNLWYDKNDKDRLLVRCCKLNQNPGCPFRLWASWMSEERTFQIKSITDVHNCSRGFKFGSVVTYKWIAKRFLNEILIKPKTSLRKMKAECFKLYSLNVSVGQCRNARRYALQEIEGTLQEHYAKLWSYALEIRRANPGSTCKLNVNVMPDGAVYFSRFYVCIKAVKDGWIDGCRRVIGVDGAFLKGICRGELLSAVGRDSNNHIMRLKGQSWNLHICPSVRSIIKKLKEQQRFWTVSSAGYDLYEVRLGYDAYAVDLSNRTCGCRSWQLTGIPCLHGIAAISHLNREAEDYVSTWYTTTMFANCYKHSINPLNGSQMWPTMEANKVLPPKRRRLPGRPTVKRKRDQSEREEAGKTRHTVSKRGQVKRCGICRETGHNKTTCPQKPVDAETGSGSSKGGGCKRKSSEGSSSGTKTKPSKQQKFNEDNLTDVDPAAMSDLEDEDDSEMEEEETDHEGNPADMETVEYGGNVVQQTVDEVIVDSSKQRTRKLSERITKMALSRQVGGVGSTEDQPLDLE